MESQNNNCKNIGRPHSFNKNDALQKAMDIFWLKGYKDTSISDLLEGLGIKKSSFYNDFKSKHDIFLLSIKHYQETLVAKLIKILTQENNPKTNIYGIFEYFLERIVKYNDTRGCMLGNAINEVVIHDFKIKNAISQVLTELLGEIAKNIEKGQREGTFKNKNTPQDLANFIILSLQGVLMLAKLNQNIEPLKQNVAIILSLLEKE